MQNILSKSYTGAFYIITWVLSLALTVLNTDQIADLNLPWVGPAISALGLVLLITQKLTPIGDTTE